MLTSEQFLERAPEWRTAKAARITAALAAAEKRTDPSVFGTLTDDAHFYLTAHLLAVSPTGKAARLDGASFRTLYLDERERIEREAAAALSVSLVDGT
jgi:hypothetical protein